MCFSEHGVHVLSDLIGSHVMFVLIGSHVMSVLIGSHVMSVLIGSHVMSVLIGSHVIFEPFLFQGIIGRGIALVGLLEMTEGEVRNLMVRYNADSESICKLNSALRNLKVWTSKFYT